MSQYFGELHKDSTPLEIIANVSRIVALAADRISGDRNEVPLMVAAGVSAALKNFNIKSNVMYGQVAWIEVMEDQSLIWTGCWGENFHFWCTTQFGEVIDLNTSVAIRKRTHTLPEYKPLYSPPILWSREVPAFYRYVPQGIAEIELTEERDQKQFDLLLREINEKCGPQFLLEGEPEFLNEPILCPGRRILDDSHQSFKHFDRALSVRGIPKSPI